MSDAAGTDGRDVGGGAFAADAAAIAAVAGFQLRRLRTWPRLAMAAVGALFPAAVMLMVNRVMRGKVPGEVAVGILYLLIPEAVCMLGLLVTMCPAVADELERGTWAHVATRPNGRRSLLLGTWLAAVIWTSLVALAAVAAALPLARVERPDVVAVLLTVLVLLSCVGRAALFDLPAVVMPKRALVASVVVGLVVEYVAGLIPAVVNQASVGLRLRSLMVAWMGWRKHLPPPLDLFVDRQPTWLHVLAVLVLAAVFLAAAVFILERRQFPPSDEI